MEIMKYLLRTFGKQDSAGMSNENSSPVSKNSSQLDVDQIIFFGSWSNDKSLNSVAVYEHERLNKIELEQ